MAEEGGRRQPRWIKDTPMNYKLTLRRRCFIYATTSREILPRFNWISPWMSSLIYAYVRARDIQSWVTWTLKLCNLISKQNSFFSSSDLRLWMTHTKLCFINNSDGKTQRKRLLLIIDRHLKYYLHASDAGRHFSSVERRALSASCKTQLDS